MRPIFDKPLISSRRPKGVTISTWLGKIVARLDQVSIVYQLPVSGEAGSCISGTGNLRIEKREDQLQCRVAGDVFRSNPFEFAFHSFWLTRRGMILLVVTLVVNQPEAAFYIKTKGNIDLALKTDARRWLRRQTSAGS
jgi:hypothetical protein